MSPIITLLILIFFIAFIYSSVGHGGASGYLALLALFSFPHNQMASSALLLNCIVASIAFRTFAQVGHFDWKLTWPFILTSVPAAFIGGLLKISSSAYFFLLGSVLVFAASRLILETVFQKISETQTLKPSSPLLSLFFGSGIGVLSGAVGIGGGIFLSPLLILLRWSSTKEAAASSAFFILVNSTAGIFGRILRHNFNIEPFVFALLLMAFFGAVAGSSLGAHYFSHRWLKRVLAGVLIFASFHLFT